MTDVVCGNRIEYGRMNRLLPSSLVELLHLPPSSSRKSLNEHERATCIALAAKRLLQQAAKPQ